MTNFYPLYTEKSFKELATLFAKHYGVIQMGWSIEMMNHEQNLGECCYESKTLKFSRQLLSKVNNLQRLDTILHEISHAIAGAHAEHGRGWKEIAKKLGANPSSTALLTNRDLEYSYTWQTICPMEHKFGTHHPSEQDLYATCPFGNCNLYPTWYKYGVALDTLSEYAKV